MQKRPKNELQRCVIRGLKKGKEVSQPRREPAQKEGSQLRRKGASSEGREPAKKEGSQSRREPGKKAASMTASKNQPKKKGQKLNYIGV